MPTSISCIARRFLSLMLAALFMPAVVLADLPLWLPVTTDGLYRVGFDELGLRQPVDSSRLALSRDGQPVAISVSDGGDGLFGAGDTLVFYGQAMPRSDRRYQYTAESVYRLELAAASAAERMQEVVAYSGLGGRLESSYPARVHLEQDRVYWQQMPNGSGRDRWFWQARSAASTVTFRIAGLNRLSKLPMRLRIRLHGFVDQGHSSEIELNGRVIGNVDWSGVVATVIELPIFPRDIRAGDNTLVVRDRNGAGDPLYFDWLEIDYGHDFSAVGDLLAVTLGSDFSRYQILAGGFSGADVEVYDISDPLRPRRLVQPRVTPAAQGFQVHIDGLAASGRYLFVGSQAYRGLTARVPDSDDLRATGNGADYIVITDPSLATALTPLLHLRESQGLRTRLVTVQAIYDDFAGGHADPDAIREFLSYARANWQPPAARYVLLAGDGHFDYRDHFATHEPNLVPPHMIGTAGIGEAPSDHWFVTPSGALLPAMAVGRLPAKTATGMRYVVDKILKYEAGMRGDWASRLLVVGGDDKGANGDQRFATVSNDWLRHVPATFAAVSISPVNVPVSQYPVLKGDLLRQLNGGGAGFVSYFGHGTIDGWLASDLNVGNNALELLTSADVGSELFNDRAFPFVAAFNCLNGLFSGTNDGQLNDFPGLPGSDFARPLAEAFLVREDAGAIAVWTTSSLSYPSDQVIVGDALYQAIFASAQSDRLGTMLNGVLQAALTRGVDPEVVAILSLFGDPAMSLTIAGRSGAAPSPVVTADGGGGALWSLGWLLLWRLRRSPLLKKSLVNRRQ